jgi:hypothetical protein
VDHGNDADVGVQHNLDNDVNVQFEPAEEELVDDSITHNPSANSDSSSVQLVNLMDDNMDGEVQQSEVQAMEQNQAQLQYAQNMVRHCAVCVSSSVCIS